MSISFSCSGCEKKLKVRDDLAGKRVKCPGCQGVLIIPTLAVLPTAPDMSAARETGTGVADKAAIQRVQVPPCQLPDSGT